MSRGQRLTTIEWLRRLVAHPTVAGQSNLALIEDVRSYLERWGATATVLPGTREGAVNLYATIGAVGQSGVVLSGHSDVVAASIEDWTSDPFELDRRGGRLFGRGTCDMKGFVASVLSAIPALVAMNLPRPIGIALSADEEMGVRGVGPMLDVISTIAPKPLYCVVGEPTQMRVAVAHKGKVALRVSVQGKAAHASAPHLGVNAIAHAAALITAISRHCEELAQQSRDQRFAVPHMSVNVGTIAGGVAMNVIADRCVFEVEFRLLPGQSPESIVKEVQALAARGAAEMRTSATDAGITLEVIAEYPGLDVTGEVPRLVASLADSDCEMFADFGTEAGLFHQRLAVPVVICGPGDAARAHTVDEYIQIDELDRCDRFIRRLANWLYEA